MRYDLNRKGSLSKIAISQIRGENKVRKFWQAVLAIFSSKAEHPTTRPPVPLIGPDKPLKWKKVILPNGVRADIVEDFKPVLIVWKDLP